MDNSKIIDVIIPSYNGRKLLQKNLHHIIKKTSYLNKVIIIDNGSEDDTIPWLTKNYPEVVIIKNKTNLGYTIPINQGIKVSKSEYFILINNDVIPLQNYVKNTLSFFKNDKLFAVSFNEKLSSWPNMAWSEGKIQFLNGVDKSKVICTPWASGGSALFRRSIWDKLGGMDEIYAPWYWEDIDIGYRAWKSGYQIIWDPKSTVIHHHESTSKLLDQNYVSRIKQRNELLFNWLNVNDKSFVIGHLLFLVQHTIKHPGYLRIIAMAILRLILKRPIRRKFLLSDADVLKLISNKYEN